MPTKGTGWGIATPTARSGESAPYATAPALAHTMINIIDGRKMLVVDNHEFGLIVSGLRKMKRKLDRDQRRQIEQGFAPKPGCIDLPAVKGATLARLMERLGISERGERS